LNKQKKIMKKTVFGLLVVIASLFAGNSANAQQKIGVFDVDIMVQAMPGYRGVDSLLQIYERDSLRLEYDYALGEYNRLDSTYKADSAKKAPASVLTYVKDQRTQVATTLIYWQQISQNRMEGKRQQLAGPLYDRILTAYQKVLQGNNYLVVLKPGAFEMGSKVENVFEKVAKELKITLPEQLRSSPQDGGDKPAAPGTTRPPASGTRPTPKKP
jgi:Skp family chaperone for outer membrane proteins